MDQIQGQIPNTSPNAQIPSPTSTPPAANVPIPPTPPSQNYFARLYSGRVNRRNFIIGNLAPTVTLILLTFLLLFINEHNPFAVSNLDLNPGQPILATPQVPLILRAVDIIAILICILVTIYILVYTISLMIRRLHDLNKTGWLLLLSFIPVVSFFLGIYVTFFPGTVKENKYGVQPLPRINIKEDILRF